MVYLCLPSLLLPRVSNVVFVEGERGYSKTMHNGPAEEDQQEMAMDAPATVAMLSLLKTVFVCLRLFFCHEGGVVLMPWDICDWVQRSHLQPVLYVQHQQWNVQW